MSGHNKWSKVKHKKAVTDAKKSKVYSKYSTLISLESKKCGGDMGSPTLKALIDRAKGDNVPVDIIERAVEKGKLKVGGETSVYEIYGPGGVGLLVLTETDNKNRTVAEIKHLVGKMGGTFASPGSVQWAFKNEGGDWIPNTYIDVTESDKEKLNKLIESLEEHDDVEIVFTNANLT